MVVNSRDRNPSVEYSIARFDQPPPIKPFRPAQRYFRHRSSLPPPSSSISSWSFLSISFCHRLDTRVSSSMNWGGGFPWGKGWRERERERGGTKREGEKEGRKEIRERTSEDSYFPSRWMKRRGAGGVREWLKVYPKRQVGDHCLDESTKKLLFHPCILGSSSVNRHLSQRSPIHIPGNNRTTRDSY